jgi:ubiquinone/menaquinone biosynthesis C-methylase UbiE
MTGHLKSFYDFGQPGAISTLDELSLWSAPFGLKILDTVRYKKGINALDIGFGLGFPLIELAMRLGNSSKVYGIDPWAAAIERAKQKMDFYGLTNVETIKGIAENMPLENNFFDLMVSNNGLNNVEDLPKTLTECNRVAKPKAQFVFTLNTEASFIEFYDTFRQVLNQNSLSHLNNKVSAQIYAKRKPVWEILKLLKECGFKVNSIDEDKFHYRFADGTAMLNHFFIKLAFLESWKKILPDDLQETIFSQTEEKLNAWAAKAGGFSMQVPFVTIDCEKESSL